eukprot:6551247-Lingulodinium_polyedra.AAC.1
MPGRFSCRVRNRAPTGAGASLAINKRRVRRRAREARVAEETPGPAQVPCRPMPPGPMRRAQWSRAPEACARG